METFHELIDSSCIHPSAHSGIPFEHWVAMCSHLSLVHSGRLAWPTWFIQVAHWWSRADTLQTWRFESTLRCPGVQPTKACPVGFLSCFPSGMWYWHGSIHYSAFSKAWSFWSCPKTQPEIGWGLQPVFVLVCCKLQSHKHQPLQQTGLWYDRDTSQCHVA